MTHTRDHDLNRPHDKDVEPPVDQTDSHRTTRRASKFFWTVLVFATVTSIAGNVTHALIKTHSNSVIMLTVAAAVAVIPPAVLLLATHSVSMLVRTRTGTLVHRAAVGITIILAACAFRLSFDALKELAITAGVRNGIDWLWPLSVDLTIAQATLALLALNRPRPAVNHSETATQPIGATSSRLDEYSSRPDEYSAERAAPAGVPETHRPPDTQPAPAALQRVNEGDSGEDRAIIALNAFPPARGRPNAMLASFRDPSLADDDGLIELAQACVDEKVTLKTVDETLEVLRLWDKKVPTTTIAERTSVHRDTVKNIINFAQKLLSDAEPLRA